MRAAFLATVLALAACGGEGQQDAAAPEPAATATSVASLPEPAAQAASSPTIPARFIGVWDAETGSCDPASDLRLDITPQAIGFYESLGTLTRVTEDRDGRTTVDLAMEGEGDRWEMSMTLRLTAQGSEAGDRLIVQHKGEPGEPAPAPLTLKRCPA
jgi:hypothetical protein